MVTDDVNDIIVDYIKTNNMDGLFNETEACACTIEDLAPCGALQKDCETGWKKDCGEHDYHISPEKK